MTFKHGAGPRLRAQAAVKGLGGRTYVERSSGVEQGLGLGPAEKGRGSTSRGVPLSVEFWSLEVRPWVRVCGWGLGPLRLEGFSEGVSKCQV